MGGSSLGQPSHRLYAELLPNIRQVTLYVSLPPFSTSDLNITLSPDCQTIETTYQEESSKLRLPTRISEASRDRLKFNQEQKHGGEFSFRLPVDENQSAQSEREGDGDCVPWGATHLGFTTRLRCRQCQNQLLRNDSDVGDSSTKKSSQGLVFKDLPSQNWAEMMDFWHCHKPDEPGHDHDHNHSHDDQNGHGRKEPKDPNETVKGYGASNRLVATAGTVLVDVSSFVIAEDDGVGLKKEPSENQNQEENTKGTTCSSSDEQPNPRKNGHTKVLETRTAKLLCRYCGITLGAEDNEVVAGGWRIDKASVSVFPGLNKATTETNDLGKVEWETYPVETIMAAQLSELIEREGLRRFVVHCSDSDDNGGLLLWVFNPDIRYSSSHSQDTSMGQLPPTSGRAMKVFYQYLSASKVDSLLANELGERQSTSVGELDLHSGTVLKELKGSLEGSTQMLPIPARKFQEWNVGVMNRT
ncbi:hypothetical protein FQN54_009170 [Arachnomyces sp. PD_36]|nr:hypothetical protein FQN54_009170 [Arachnomyces sp. PD_36]